MWQFKPADQPQGIALEPVSMGKGFVQWRIVYPPLVKKNRRLQSMYDSYDAACTAIKQHCERSAVDPTIAEQVEAQCPDLAWGSGEAATAAS